jgi:hypothetical protein
MTFARGRLALLLLLGAPGLAAQTLPQSKAQRTNHAAPSQPDPRSRSRRQCRLP